MFKRVFWFTLGGLAALIGLFFLAGNYADVQYSGSRSEVINAPIEKVWQLISDTQGFSASRHEVASVEMLGTNASGFTKWNEHTNLGGVIALEIIDQKPFEFIEVRMNESGFGMKGTWKYAFESEGAQTKVTITENSSTEGLVMRSILNLLGRDANMGLHLNAIKKGVQAI